MHVCEWPQKCYKYWFWGYQYILVSRHILDVESSNNEDWPYLLAISRATCISLCRIQSPTSCFPSSHPSLITRAALCKWKKGAPFSGWMQIYWPIPECTAWWVEHWLDLSSGYLSSRCPCTGHNLPHTYDQLYWSYTFWPFLCFSAEMFKFFKSSMYERGGSEMESQIKGSELEYMRKSGGLR